MRNFSINNYKTIVIQIITIVFFVGINSKISSQVQTDSLLMDTTKGIIHILGADAIVPMDGNINVAKIYGNARFMQDSVFMRCDIGYLDSKLQFLKAVGNVIINQGDSLYLYGDSLDYDGATKIAIVRGNVRLVENDLTLTAPSIKYNLTTNVAYYTQGGTVVSKKNSNTLTSTYGYYYSKLKTLSFKDSVVLTNPEYVMTSDTLDYDEVSEIAYFSGNTFIEGEGNLIFCKNGFYDTRYDIAEFNKDAYLISDGHQIEGQKLYYDRNKGIGRAIGDISLTDTANKIIVTGDYGTRNEQNNTSFVTGNALVNKWFEEGDTLFLSSDTIMVVKNDSSKQNSLFCYHSVRFFKADIQGVCDSMVYLQSDSMLKMFQSPVIWSENSQMNGDTIYIQLANSKIKELRLRRNSFIIETVMSIDSVTESGQYNQIKGKNVRALFREDSIRKVIVTGNGQSIYFTGDDGKPKQGLNRIDCSDIEMRFKENKLNEILFITLPDGQLLPIQDVKKEDEKLKGFEWRIDEKPTSKNDLINNKSNE